MNKNIIIAALLATFSLGSAAQTTDTTRVENDTVPVITNGIISPQFPGGQEALTKFLSKNINYPETAESYGVEGTVVMTFFVNENGSLSDISAQNCTIDRFITTKFGQETEARQRELKEQFALSFAKEGARAIRKMPKWVPGTLNGKAVRMRVSQRINFVNPNGR